jgi:hypothetical protein
MEQPAARRHRDRDAEPVSRGLLMVLANVAPEDEAEFNRWYDSEHMSERVSIPGFLSAQRYRSGDPGLWKYLALYHTESIATFTSPVYREALANQSSWSTQILTRFRDPQRVVAARTARAGYGIGGTVRLARLRPRPGAADSLRKVLVEHTLPEAVRRAGIVEASLFESDPALSGPVPEYPRSSIDTVRRDDWFLLLHAHGSAEAESAPAAVWGDLSEAFEWIGAFTMLFDLHRSDL